MSGQNMLTISEDAVNKIANRTAIEYYFSGIDDVEDVALVNEVLNNDEWWSDYVFNDSTLEDAGIMIWEPFESLTISEAKVAIDDLSNRFVELCLEESKHGQ